MTSLFALPSQPERVHAALSLYELTVRGEALATTHSLTRRRFDVSDYSRFKYGWYPQIEQYGTLLAEALTAYFGTSGVKAGERIVLLGTPFKSVPNAAKLLADVAERKLRVRGFNSSIARIYQHRLAEGDYGLLSAAKREERNRQKKYFFDAADYAGTHVVVVDDVRITGSIERSVIALLGEIDWLSLTVINLVRLDPEVALRNPGIENDLNHASIRSLQDLVPLMAQRDQFVLITRTVKRILEADLSELQGFLSQLDAGRLAELHRAAVDDGYDQMERYEASFRLLTKHYPY